MPAIGVHRLDARACAGPPRNARPGPVRPGTPPSRRSAPRTSARGSVARSTRRRGSRATATVGLPVEGAAAVRQSPSARGSITRRGIRSVLRYHACSSQRKDSMNILVTGGAGFIGSHMAKRHLDDGHRVVIVDDLSSGRRERLPEAARFVQADIAETDLEPLLREEKIDFVSHHAAQIDLRHSVADPIGDARANIIGGLKLFEAMRRAGVTPRPLLLDRRRHLRRARGWPARDREPPDQPRLALRLRQALDREVPALLPRRARLPDAGLPLRQRLRPVAGRHGRGRRRRDLRRGDARVAAARRSTATASRRATTSTSATSSRPPPARPRATRAASGTSARASRRRSTGSSGSSRGEYGYTATPPHVPAPAGRAEAQRPRRLPRPPRLRSAALDARSRTG